MRHPIKGINEAVGMGLCEVSKGTHKTPKQVAL